ncbi:MAG: flavin reductase [Spirochaetes bacterium GWF1_51_8]|nr:MAG: flavin reductase [Spirochaetes bacterium GWF1_51_8]
MDLTALFKISYGVFLVTSRKGEEYNGQVSNTVFQINSEPPTIEIVINKLNLTHDYLMNSEYFGVAVLNEETPMTYIGRFGFKSGRDIDKFEGIEYATTANGIRIPLEYTVAWLECQIITKVDTSTHTIFIGRLTDSKVLTEDDPMTYKYYHTVKKGKEPKTAPTYVKLDNPQHS